jgi:glycerol-3-phosphate acyltransferase PlsX
MKIIVDAFGGDNAPVEILKGCRMALDELPDLELVVTGKEDVIKQVMQEQNLSMDRMTIVHAPTVITMEDQPTDIRRAKKDCSMAVGLRSLAAGEGDAFISAGSTGALVVGATTIVKRIKGIKRAALAPVIPADKGCFMLIDSGANMDCKPEYLHQFGIMGSVYMENVMGYKNPTVGLVNVGTEDCKGGELQHEAFALLKADTSLNFMGNIEARTIPSGETTVVVADGFTGNVVLKMYEGVSSTLLKKIKGVFMMRFTNKLAALVLKKDVTKLKNDFDPSEVGGTPLLGISKLVIKAHGSSDARAIYNAVRQALAVTKANVIPSIDANIEYMRLAPGVKEE